MKNYRLQMEAAKQTYITTWTNRLQKVFWRNPDRLTATKVLCAIGVLILPFVLTGKAFIGVTLSLGTVAAALSETDDHPRGRLKALLITIISFAITTVSVSFLKDYPIFFGIGFIASTIVFVIIGGISERYKGISYGAILIGIYAMLVYNGELNKLLIPTLLCSGALFYGLISLLLLYHKPWRLLEEQLSRGFTALAGYLEEKAKNFPGVEDEQADIGHKLALLNIQVVSALERCKQVINIYGQEVKNQKELLPYLQRLMLLQSLHERAASSHERYEKLNKKVEYKELLEGFAELLHQLSHASQLVAENMLTGASYNHPVSIGWIIHALEIEIEKIPYKDRQLLELFLHNLTRSHHSLKNLNNPEESTSIPRLGQDSRNTWQRIKDQLNWSHPRLRYAIRLSSCFLIGFLIVHFFKQDKGEWIMLTSLFVSQPTYSETRRKLFQRILGTITGVVIGVVFLQILPTQIGQFLLLLMSAFLFFYWLRTKYSNAVIFITIYVLATNSLTSDIGFNILTPRIVNTFIGALLSFLAIRFLWPNWQHKVLPQLLSEAFLNNARYFLQIIHDFKKHSEDDYDYRLARRLAHKSDNALTLSWQSMQVEPRKRKSLMRQAFTLTYLNHALLAHLSALGAHRDDKAIDYLNMEMEISQIENALKEAAKTLNTDEDPDQKTILKPLLIQLRDRINQSNNINEKKKLRLLYNIAGVSNKLLRESSALGNIH
ncbi:hypothetical protein E9993_06650 [Labilibacter sediminis]|nr:hypothetical protein E9993_06650 [Labilibacter sediminis]